MKPVKFVKSCFFTGLLATAMGIPAFAADLTVYIPNVKQSEGQLMVAVFDSAETFNKERLTGIQKKAVSGEMVFTFNDLAVGDYAIMLFHDVNGNGDLDYNLLGIPKEPWGGSLQGKAIFGAPSWKDVRFDMPKGDMTLIVKLN